jgi:hypothetical protein
VSYLPPDQSERTWPTGPNAYPELRAARRELAYLTDRLLLAGGELQEYGTQVTVRGRQYEPQNLRDPDAVAVDERRGEVGGWASRYRSGCYTLAGCWT